MRGFFLLAVATVAACLTAPASGETWYVGGATPASGDGKSPQRPLQGIQIAIDAASPGDTVIVEEGTYPENIRFKGKNIILRSSDPLDPEVVKNTILDGGKAGAVVTFAGTENDTCVLSGFTICNGSTDREGGGIYGGPIETGHTRATIQNNIIRDNSATCGGGVSACDGRIENNTITGNTAEAFGGGVHDCGGLVARRGVIQNNIISGNSAQSYGGGVYWCHGRIRGNIISGNSAIDGGGLNYCNDLITNNVIVDNTAAQRGGGVSGCEGTIINCIIWANSAPNGTQLLGSSHPTYCCIQEWTEGGVGNIGANPMFVDPGGDYRLLEASPCIDAGRNEKWMWDAVDVEGNPRIFPATSSWRVDMGAHEYIPPDYPFTDVIRATADGVQVMWTSPPEDTYTVSSRGNLSKGGWTDEATILSKGAITRWTDTAPEARVKFYRLEIEQSR